MEKSGATEYVQRRERRRNVRLDLLDHPRRSNSPEIERSQSDNFRVENFLLVID